MVVPTTASFRFPSSSSGCGKKIFLYLAITLALIGFTFFLAYGFIFDEDDEDLQMPPKQVSKGKEVRMTLDLAELEDSHSGDEIDELPNFAGRDQTDPELIQFIQSEYLLRPAPRYEPYSLPNVHIDTALGFWVRNFFKDKRGLVFVEAGAADGTTSTNTLTLEKELGWSGVLIECNPKVTPALVSVKRKAWVAPVCISDNNKAQKVTLHIPKATMYEERLARLGGPWDFSHFGSPDSKEWTKKEDLDAVPLYSILAAVGLKQIDYLNMDLQGIEMKVLKNFPFDKIPVKVLMVDVYFLSTEEREDLKAFLKKKGFEFVRDIQSDHIYVHKDAVKDPDVEPKWDEL